MGKLGRGPAEVGGGWPHCGSLGSLQPYGARAVAKQMVWSFLWPSLAWGALARHSHHGAQLLLGCSLALSELLCESGDFLACSTMVQYQRKMRKPGRGEKKHE